MQQRLYMLLAVCLALTNSPLVLMAQTSNYVSSGNEVTNFGIVDLATPSGQTWTTERVATPGFFSAFGTATYTGASDASNVNGYVKHYVTTANQGFVFPVGSGTDLRTLTTSGTIAINTVYGTAWIAGDPSSTTDPTAPSAGFHAVSSKGASLSNVSTVGQWDWLVSSGSAAGVTITVSIPDMSAFALATDLRLAGWNGTQWINLSGNTGASGNTENSTLSGTMVAGISALAIGKASALLAVNTNPAIQTVTSGVSTTASTATILAPSGGTQPYTYSVFNPTSGTAASGTGPLATAHGLVSIDPTTGVYAYTATPGYSGTDAVGINVCDASTPTQCASSIIPLNIIAPTASGMLDCNKTQLISTPLVGTPSELVLKVTVIVSTTGTFPITVSGSGMTLAYPGYASTASTTGTQSFYIPVKYDGSALGALTFTLGGAGSCSTDLATLSPSPRNVNVMSLDNCTAITPVTLNK